MIFNADEVDEAIIDQTGNSPRIRGDEHIHTCPFCGKRGHFYVNYRKGVYNCYRCGDDDDQARGSVEKLAGLLGVELDAIEEIPSVDEMSRALEVDELAAVSQQLGLGSTPDEEPVAPPVGFEYLSTLNSGRYFQALSYLIGRGISWPTIQYYRLGVAECGTKIVFPDYNSRGELRWWQLRKIDDYQRGPKYQGPPGDKGGKIGNWYRALSLPVDFLGVCEGPISGIAAGPEFCWLWGKQSSTEQVDTLARCGRLVAVALDGEARAYRSALGLVEKLRDRGAQAVIVPVPGEHDPASMGTADFRHLLTNVLHNPDDSDLGFLETVLTDYVKIL